MQIAVYPASEPRPVLRYELLPPLAERIRGNAAVYYGKVTAENHRLFVDTEIVNQISKWASTPADQLRNEVAKVNPNLSFDGTWYYYLREAARCDHCDWQLPIGREDFFTILLPEVQQSRQFCRMLVARARWQIVNGDFNGAIQTLQVGYALARHVAAGEPAVNALVAIACSSRMSQVLLELIQQPKAPNLYWALTVLPQPFIDLRTAIETEMQVLRELGKEGLPAELAKQPIVNPCSLASSSREILGASPEWWRHRLIGVLQKLHRMSGGSSEDDWGLVLAPVVIGIDHYPLAQRTLIAYGYPPDDVERMPVAQTLLLYRWILHVELADQMGQWAFLPYWQVRDQVAKIQSNVRRASSSHWTAALPPAQLFLPASFFPPLEVIIAASVRHEREIAVIRLIEALRLYAAAHDGQLPNKLSDLPVPEPLDPVTGKSFEYRLRLDGTAILSGPSIQGWVLNIQLRVVGPE